MKLLITSVGSLIGQNILDCIESRRNLITVIGINSEAENPRNFRCDKVYFVHNTLSEYFYEEFNAIVKNEEPDLILPGRDLDTIFLTDHKSKHPAAFAKIIPFGNSTIPKIIFDKYQTHLFCKQNHLPYADTILVSKNNKTGLNEFIEKYGFPLIVKPREGFGSLGVYFVLNTSQVNELATQNELLVQEYLGNPEEIYKYKDEFKKGIPLFFQVEEKEQYAAQTIISQDGKVSEIFITINTMIHGRAEYTKQIANAEIEKLVVDFSKIIFEKGWYGPLNFQLKPDRYGNWKVFELNPRFTGTSSGRNLLGYDEFGMMADLLFPEFMIPNFTKSEKVEGQVIKYLNDNLLLDKDTNSLKVERYWEKNNYQPKRDFGQY